MPKHRMISHINPITETGQTEHNVKTKEQTVYANLEPRKYQKIHMKQSK